MRRPAPRCEERERPRAIGADSSHVRFTQPQAFTKEQPGPGTLFIVEAKLDSGNKTTPSRPGVLDVYRKAERNWYDTVFRTEPGVVAQKLELYQLMRLWLLGTWMAARAGKRLVLLSLTPESRERDVVSRFAPHIVSTGDRQFVRATWERIREHVRPETGNRGLAGLVDYLDHKTLGYDTAGELRLAFSTVGSWR